MYGKAVSFSAADYIHSRPFPLDGKSRKGGNESKPTKAETSLLEG